MSTSATTGATATVATAERAGTAPRGSSRWGVVLLLLSAAAIASVFLPWFSVGEDTLSGRTVIRDTDPVDGMPVLLIGALGILGSLLYLLRSRILRLICAVGGLLGGLVIAGVGIMKTQKPGSLSAGDKELFQLAYGQQPTVTYGLYAVIVIGLAIALVSALALRDLRRGRG